MPDAAALDGCTVVVTRAAEQASSLVRALADLGAVVVEVPTIAVVDPVDRGVALTAAAHGVAQYDWVVLTSANGASRFADSLDGTRCAVPVAVVGPGTADVLRARGIEPALVPQRFVAEGLLEVFPPGPGRVLLAQAEAARPVLADGLRALGWDVDAVVAYRTIHPPLEREVWAAACRADVITFTSASTVTGYVAVAGRDAVPPAVVCIGPVTAEAAEQAGLTVTAVADPHTIEGLVDAVKAVAARPTL